VIRGLLLGVSWGGLLAAAAVTTVSLVYSNANRAPVADTMQEQAAEPTPDSVVEPNVAQESVVTSLADASDANATESAVPKVMPDTAPDTAPDPEHEETTELATAEDTPVAEDTPAAVAMSEGEATTSGDTAQVQTPKVMPPAEPEADLAATTDSAPTTSMTEASVSPAATEALPDSSMPEIAPQTDVQIAEVTPPASQDAPETAATDETDQADVPKTMDAPSETPDVQPAALPQIIAPDAPQIPQQEATLVVPTPVAPPATQTPEQTPAETAPEPAAPATQGQFDTARVPVPKITNLAPNVKTNRLPTIGGDSQAEVVEANQGIAPESDKGALLTHAMKFENPDAKPMFSVVLIDDPAHPISDEVLSHLPFALSFAVDAVRDDAHMVAARYRKAGFEVLMLTNLPFGANATDVEVAFGAYARAIPEAVAVLDLGANGFLRGPSTATQIAGIMSDKGYGLITPSKGLNSAQKAAMREGVPAALVFRELDEDGEKPSVIRRYLDRAAFRAAQEGSVIMLGHTRADTIEALVTWALEDRAASVAIAPVSAVLLAQ